jgi:hypothetical protein
LEKTEVVEPYWDHSFDEKGWVDWRSASAPLVVKGRISTLRSYVSDDLSEGFLENFNTKKRHSNVLNITK